MGSRPRPYQTHTGEAVSQESRCTEQNRTGGRGRQTKGLGCEPRSRPEEGRADECPPVRIPRQVSMSGR